MSSSHLVIIARNIETGEIKLPLGNMTLYGTGGEQQVLEQARKQFSADWLLEIYEPYYYTNVT